MVSLSTRRFHFSFNQYPSFNSLFNVSFLLLSFMFWCLLGQLLCNKIHGVTLNVKTERNVFCLMFIKVKNTFPKYTLVLYKFFDMYMFSVDPLLASSTCSGYIFMHVLPCFYLCWTSMHPKIYIYAKC